MINRASGQINVRSRGARAGIAALNLISPGLGLLRIGHWRSGVLFLLAPFLLGALLIFAIGHFPITSYGRAVLALAAVVVLAAALYVVSAVTTWRDSNFRLPAHRWSRWYGLTAIVIVTQLLLQLALPFGHQFYKPFYAPSESMAPTIAKGDKFIADMGWRGPVRRGEIIIYKGSDGTGRVKRVAAVAGDRISMHGGVPVLNGKPVLQSPQGTQGFIGYDGSHSVTVLTERLPGEMSTHRVFNIGPSEFDDMQEVVVPAGHVFVLGDNRDGSADSRVPIDIGGVGMVPLAAIIGRPMYIHWSSDRSKIGTRLDRQ